ncbi:MAG TPA: hypothetical protein VNM37_16825, partial [Candidatus Dormibacteraeota bacterium]|nr:hypothetical protein [Candidatus Dormibacteraeota bacterium]
APDAATPPAAPAPAPALIEPTPEMAAVLTDLHWLVHQGHVIEFANGVLETAKKPLPKPPPPPKPASPAPAVPETAAAFATPSPGNSPAPEAPPGPEAVSEPLTPASPGEHQAD